MMHTEWGWLVAIYLFLGGLGAGALAYAALFELTGRRYEGDRCPELCPVTLVGATVSGPIVAAGTVLLIFDLGAGLREPWRIPLMYTHPSSVMTWGVWLLTLFIPVAFLYGFLELAHVYPSIWEWVVERLEFLRDMRVRRVKRFFAGLGGILALGVAFYTGLLISAVGPAVPFWSTPLVPFLPLPTLPVLFLISALSTGEALTVDLMATLFTRGQAPRGRREHFIHLGLITGEAVIVGQLLAHAFLEGGAAAQSAHDILIGPHSIVFWVFVMVLAFVVPFVGHVYAAGRGRHQPSTGLISGTSLIISGLFLRYLIIVSGVHAFL
jgi:formate-dependent nitrite reductase membrane component NrfD